MKKIILRCISNNNSVSKYHIIIFDKCNNNIFNGYIKNNTMELYLNKGVYKAIIAPFDIESSILLTSFIIFEKTNYLNFYFSRNDNLSKITVILVDSNYYNLPIERGELNLWQDHIQ